MKRKIIIENKTDYRTTDLRRFVNETAKRFLPERTNDGFLIHALKIEVQYKRAGTGRRGLGMVGHFWQRLLLERDGQNKIYLARTIWHEFQHNLGFGHRDIIDPDLALFEYANQLPLEKKMPVLAERTSRDEVLQAKLNHANAQIKKWQTKVKRAQTALKKWQRKAKYYSKRAGV